MEETKLFEVEGNYLSAIDCLKEEIKLQETHERNLNVLFSLTNGTYMEGIKENKQTP